MSKIYEALLQAEREKKGAASGATAVEERPRNAIREVSDNLLGSTQLGSGATPASIGGMLGGTPASLQLLPAARMEIWKPNLSSLPSALTQGGKTEQFRSLRSKLAGLRHLQQMRSVAIVSAHASEGKSFVASNLAVTLARSKNARVLLIDGDMRRGTLHKILGAPNKIGLAEYLSGTASLEQVLQRGQAAEDAEPLPASIANITFCPCGHAHDRAAELSGSTRFAELISGLAQEFDWIIVDTSPVNIVSDGVNLARASDSALLVVRAAQTKFEAAQRAVKELKSVKVLGVVLNAASAAAAIDGDYGYLGYGSVEKQA